MSPRCPRVRSRSAKVLFAISTTIALTPFAAIGASDSWNAGDGDYSQSSNWLGGNVPNGSGDHADFSLLDISADVTVTANQDITLGQVSFGDTNLGSAGTWALVTDNDNILTLDNGGSKPVLFGGPITPTSFDDSFIGLSLAGTNGIAKEGAGILTIAGGANSFSGGVDINAGTLRVNNTIPGQAVTIADGATLDTAVDIRGTGFSINAASGSSVNIIANTNLGTMNAAGSTINLSTPAGGGTASANDNWSANGSIAVLNVSGDDATTSFFRLRNNGGTFTASSFAGTAVNLDNITVWTRTNSGGNTNQFGSLSGTSTAVLSGGGQGGGSFANYQIGNLGTDSEFAGTIDTTSAPSPNSADDLGGLNLTKVGTGTLTLSGNLLYQPTANTTVARRGGITTVSAGTLKLTGSAAIPGGIVHGTAGNIFSTVNVQTGATLDVSGFSGSYSTAALQQIVGAGTIAGNYAHDEGIIRPANTISGTNPDSVPTGGTLSFTGNFTWNGGEYAYDLTDDPNTGNDLITVGGSTTLTSGLVIPNFLGAPPSAGTYTLLTSAGGFSGSAANISIDWPGRGADPVPFISGNNLQFTATPLNTSGNMIWRGNDATNPTFWDVQTTPNWTGATPNTFFQNDVVTFDDTATGFNVDLQDDVMPSTVAINNSTNAYNFTTTASGRISGTTGLVKTGSANLTMDVQNTFTGLAQLSGGATVDIVGRSSALGTGPLELNGVNILGSASGSSLSNSTLAVSGTNTIEANGNPGSGNLFNIPNLSGSGTLSITTTTGNPASGTDQDGKWFALNATGGFAGTFNLVGPDASQEAMVVRTTTSGGGTLFGSAVVNMTNAWMANRQGGSGTFTFTLGELHGDANSRLLGFIGGSSGRPNVNFEIGALNTDSDFAGDMTDPAGGNNSVTNLVKVGSGTLTLTGTKSYTGNTTVMDGALSIDTAYLSDVADVYLTSSSILDLNFGSLATIDTIDSLFINGVSQAVGTWGRVGSGANFESALFTGDGLLMVSTQEALLGDFDNDGDVDGIDFLVWQRNPGIGNLSDWQANYGAGALAAANSSVTAVPEPAAVVLLLAGTLLVSAGRRK